MKAPGIGGTEPPKSNASFPISSTCKIETNIFFFASRGFELEEGITFRRRCLRILLIHLPKSHTTLDDGVILQYLDSKMSK